MCSDIKILTAWTELQGCSRLRLLSTWGGGNFSVFLELTLANGSLLTEVESPGRKSRGQVVELRGRYLFPVTRRESTPKRLTVTRCSCYGTFDSGSSTSCVKLEHSKWQTLHRPSHMHSASGRNIRLQSRRLFSFAVGLQRKSQLRGCLVQWSYSEATRGDWLITV